MLVGGVGGFGGVLAFWGEEGLGFGFRFILYIWRS